MRGVALLIGRQGSGKGTIGRIVERERVLHFLSAGEVLRVEGRAETERGRQMAMLLREGEGIAPEESYPLIGKALDRLPPGDVLLDGCPRRSDEAGLVRNLFSAEPALVLELHVPLPIAVARMLERQTCVSCEAPYGPKVPPAPDARCTACGGEVIHRHDDTLESMGRRLAVWDVEGRRIMRYYEAKTTVVRIDATREPTVVAAEVIHHIRAAALGVAEASAGF